MNQYDVIIVGAGPAGGQCARTLSALGKKVLLVERNKDFSVNNFSSAGAPLEIMEAFNLPANIVGTSWNRLAIHSSFNQAVWTSSKWMGVVLDFMKLRAFLAEDMVKNGGTLKLGHSYHSHKVHKNHIQVEFKDLDLHESQQYETKILVDATGSEKQILAKSNGTQQFSSFPATGIEYLVETSSKDYEKYSHALSIFMGLKWMPQGYAWIFPMAPNQLKIGVGRYFQNDTFVPYNKSYRHYLDNLIQETLQDSNHRVIDKHGKTIIYTYGHKDPYYSGNIVAIGDAVSSINPLAFEGIRHAMHCSNIAAEHINDRLEGKCATFAGYPSDMQQYYGIKWRISEWLMKIMYRQADDHKIDSMLKAFESFSFEEMMALAFHYKPSKALKFLTRYAYYASRPGLSR